MKVRRRAAGRLHELGGEMLGGGIAKFQGDGGYGHAGAVELVRVPPVISHKFKTLVGNVLRYHGNWYVLARNAGKDQIETYARQAFFSKKLWQDLQFGIP